MGAENTMPVTSGAEDEIRVESLLKIFDSRHVLDELSFSVAAGESLVVVGASGEGKTVLLKHLIGLMSPDAGRVLIQGIDLKTASPSESIEIRKKCGMSFQEGALFDSMTVFENIAFPIRRHTRRKTREIAERVSQCLSLVRLEGIEDRRPAELSGGMRRRVGFARAIALEPEILFFDEPTTGLDPVNTAAIGRVIDHLRRELGVTVITITHDMMLAFRIADRIAMLRQGKFLIDTDPENFRRSDLPWVRAFLEGKLPEGEEDAL